MAYTDEWDKTKHDQRNALSVAVAAKYRDLFNQCWNGIAKEARAELDARMPVRITNKFHAGRMSPFFTNFPDIVKGDAQLAIIEASWAAARCQVPSFWRDLFAVYEAGHLPCGWDGGQYPNGFLVYY